MNNLKKIGLSALAGSLVAFSVNAGEMSVTGSAGMTLSQADETAAAGFAQSDSLTFTGSGETDSGLNIAVSFEIDGDTPGFDDRSFTVGNDSIGTFAFHGSGGSSVMGGWDDLTPNAYEEVWTGTTGASADVVGGIGGTNLIRYDSPSISGVTVAVAYQDAEQTATASTYTDFGIQIKPEMLDGLTVGYAEGEYSTSATLTTDESTMYALYTMGAVSVGYQESEIAAGTTATTDETVSASISYAVSDDISISYGTHTVDFGDVATDQESSGFSASYTAGGMTIAGYMNSVDNVAGGTASTDDRESYELSLSFAF